MQKYIERKNCPVCGSDSKKEFLKENTDWSKCSDYSYSSRKLPEYMNFHLSKCLLCGVVYADLIPTEDQVISQYKKALFSSSAEADCAAKSYASLLKKKLPDQKKLAIDIGCGNGALLPFLKDFGFENVRGYEPSPASYQNASDFVKEHIVPDVFSSSSIPDNSADLIIICMTLEHVYNPLELLKTIYSKLRTGGRVFLVDHNYRAPANLLFGRKSPIIDIEHLQLFNTSSLNRLLAEAGFRTLINSSFWNTYPLSYFLRLLPFSRNWKQQSILSISEKIILRFPFGNRFVFGEK